MTPTCVTASSGEIAAVASPALKAPRRVEERKAILCVDDDPVVLSLQRALLEAAGFAVITACNSVRALEEFCHASPDAVVLDYEMPGTTGVALANRLRRIRSDVPLILSSGATTIPEQQAVLFARILPKGVTAALLVRVLREMFPTRSDESASGAPLPVPLSPFTEPCLAR